MFAGESFGEFAFGEQYFTPLESTAFEAFLAEVTARRCWLLEIDAFSLAQVDALSSAFADAAFGESSFGGDSPGVSGGVQTLKYSTHGYISRTLHKVGLLELPGSVDDGQPATLGFDFLGESLAPQFGDAPITFTRAGATATRVNAQGLIETVAADTPRFDYDPVTKAPRGLLREQARTNSYLRSAEFDNAAWTKSGVTITANQATAPDGTVSMDRVDHPGGNGHVHQSVATVAGQRWSKSVFAKAGTLNTIVFEFNDGGVFFTCTFNLATGVSSGSSGNAVRMEDWGGGVYRCIGSRTWTNNGNVGTTYIGAYGASAAGNLFLWGAQAEQGNDASSYIPTTSAAVTRQTDVADITDISGFFNPLEGTLYVEFLSPQNSVSSELSPCGFDDGSGSNFIINRWLPLQAECDALIFSGGANQMDTGRVANRGAVVRSATAYRANDSAHSVDGQPVQTDVSVALPAVTTLRIGCGGNANTRVLNGHIRRLYYFPKRLANATLESISADGPELVIFEVAAGDPDSADWYDGRLAEGFRVERRIVGRDGIGGLARVFAEASLVNADGALDGLLSGYSIGGRRVRLLVGRETGRYADFGLVFTGVVESPVVGLDAVRLRLSDGLAKLERAVNETTYAGTGGLEGGADLKGKPKPKCWGKVFNIAPPLVDSVNLVYQVHDGPIQDVPAVRDRGIALVKVAGAPGAGEYQVDAAAGTFKLGATPAGTVTCDVEGDASLSGYISKTSDIVLRILVQQAGLSSSEIEPASFAQLNSDAPAAVGIWVGTEPRTVASVVDELLWNVGAFGGFTRLGGFSVGLVRHASGAAAGVLGEEDIVSIERVALPSAVEPIVWRTRVGYQRNYTVQQDLAAAVTPAQRTFAAQPLRVAKDEDTAVQSRHLLAREYFVDAGLFAVEADAVDETGRLAALWGAERAAFRVVTRLKALVHDLGEVVELKHRRLGLSAGRPVLVLGHAVRGSEVELLVLA